MAYVSSPVQPLSSVLCLAFLKEAVAAFNASMHSRYGYKGLDEPFTKTDFKNLVDFHNYLDDSCKWMAKGWLDLLEPLQIDVYNLEQ